MFEYDVFICHSSKDDPIVATLIEDFKKEDITYWVDAEQIDFGDSITGKIAEGLQKSRFVIPCLSKNLNTSGWTRAEYCSILNVEFSGNSDRIVIPLVLDNCEDNDIPILLRDKRRVTYSNSNKNEFNRFIKSLKKRREISINEHQLDPRDVEGIQNKEMEELRRQREETKKAREQEEQEKLRRRQEDEARLKKTEEGKLLRKKEEEEEHKRKEIEEQEKLKRQQEESTRNIEEIKRKTLEEDERKKKELVDRSLEKTLLGNMGSAYSDLNDPRKVIEYYEKSLRIAKELGDQEEISSCESKLRALKSPKKESLSNKLFGLLK